MQKNTRSGFTLIELMIVLGIIALIISISFTFTGVQKRARDAKRKEHLRNIQSAFEQYFSICGFEYPITGDIDLVAGTSLDCADPVANFITYPKDPLGGNYKCILPGPGQCSPNEYVVCPPDLDGVAGAPEKYLEAENCTAVDQSCCLKSQQ